MKSKKKLISIRMRAVKSKWTKPEITLHNFLKTNRIKHKMHPKILANPDILVKDKNLLIFYNSCFWHKCNKCCKDLSKLTPYWKKRLLTNYKRDKRNYDKLKKEGWNVLVLWGHDMKKRNHELKILEAIR